jgi:hypothetical protein
MKNPNNLTMNEILLAVEEKDCVLTTEEILSAIDEMDCVFSGELQAV